MPDDTDNDAPPTETDAEKAERWKSFSRKNENDKKAAIAELNTVREQLTAATSRADSLAAANAAAVEKAKADTLSASRQDLVKVHVKYAAKAHGADPDALLEGRDLTGFVGEDGAIKEDAIEAWIAKVAPAGTRKAVDFGGGARGGNTPPPANPYADDDLYKALSNLTSE